MGLLADAQTKARDSFQGEFYAVGGKCAHSFAKLVSPKFLCGFPPTMDEAGGVGRQVRSVRRTDS